MHLILLLLSLTFTFSVYAQNKFMAILGGGGEPKTETTIFDSDVKEVTRFAKSNPQWNTTLSFNGGHKKTEEIIQANMGAYDTSSQAFTMKSFESIIKNYEAKILA